MHPAALRRALTPSLVRSYRNLIVHYTNPIKEKSSSDGHSKELYKTNAGNDLRDQAQGIVRRTMGESASDDWWACLRKWVVPQWQMGSRARRDG